jgi:hypothetical protein
VDGDLKGSPGAFTTIVSKASCHRDDTTIVLQGFAVGMGDEYHLESAESD